MKKSVIIRGVLIAAGAALLINAAALFLTSRSNFGVLPLALYAAALAACGLFYDKLKKQKWLWGLLIGGSAAMLVFSGGLAAYGSFDNAQYNEDAVIVLGSGVRGEEVTPNLAKRLDKAAEYYAQNPEALIIVSGGQGSGESISEALAMERYLTLRGVSAERILQESTSTSTYENFAHSKEILSKEFPQGCRAVFVTSRFHVYRAERLAKSLGLAPSHLGAGIVWYSAPMNYMREMLAVLKTWVMPA